MAKIKKPNVLVAGFPRCGSTFLNNILRQHPEIYIPKIKEINYFNKDHFLLFNPEIINPAYFKSKKWYYGFFKTNKKVVMDFSILSALDVASARRVKKELGDIKILFLTRNKDDFLNSVRKIILKWNKNYKGYEEYADFNYYINNYQQHFSKVWITSIEKLDKNPKKELDAITKFLEIKEYKFNLKVSKFETPKKTPNFFSHPKILLLYLKRKIYVKMVESFYYLISRSVSKKIKE